MLPLKVEAMQKTIYVFVPKYHKKDEKIHSKLNSDICNTHTHTKQMIDIISIERALPNQWEWHNIR